MSMSSSRESVIWGFKLDGSGAYIWDKEKGKFEATSPLSGPCCESNPEPASSDKLRLDMEGFWTEEGAIQLYPPFKPISMDNSHSMLEE